MSNKKRLKFIKRLSIVILLIGLLLIHFFVPRLITEIRNPVVGLIKRNRNIKHDLATNKTTSSKEKEFYFNSFDNTKLSAEITYSSLDSTKGNIILLHGIRSSKLQFTQLTDFLSAHGYNAIALDSRAHGKSEGQFCSFGVNEKKDITALIDYLSKNENLNHFGVWGQSLGGAIGLQAMGYDKRIKFGVIESTFSDFKTIVNDYFDLHAGFSFSPFSNYLVNRAGEIAEFDPNDAMPIKYCKSINQPILVVHGNEDKRINIKYGKANFSAIPSKHKEFIQIDSANHSNVWKVGGETYFNRVLKFLDDQYISKKSLSI
ncbi:alpha/beta fold hydrolase [Winogradskyella echinorum]|uniref:Alpha/beta fold hydrolase n=1 Tax=Winogradskyella echinorum TaxID=538189 RepID=A0ABR6Y5P7_9FLAO|nr:alpha/beta fold hydrolase [Winogradskyella echinorum]MBC3847984.1 alpha/beta fold hydrolase [Winogradskyella echinorum]MBC5752332.1 alpha/beta fold hydrolase [Winogradskyella echinorum]